MFITFTIKEFLEMLASYNTTFWPMQLVAYALGVVALIFAIRSTSYSSKIISGILTFFWLWVGVVFNWIYFSKIFPMSVGSTILFVIEGIILAATGVFKKNLSFSAKANLYGVVGGLFMLYGMVGYPAIEYLLGRGYPQLLPFGLAPCPTTVFTLGMLLWSERLPKYIVAIPFLYSLSGIIPICMGILEDIGLVVIGLIVTIMILYRDRIKKIA